MLDLLAVCIAVLLVALVVRYRLTWAGRPWTTYDAGAAWLRAGIYFCGCWLVSWASGGLELLLTSPVATADQLADASWWAYTVCAYAFVGVAYGVVWVRYTVLFDRPRTPAWSALFGVLWGLSSGQLFLAVWLFSNDTGLPEPAAWVVTWLLLGVWQPNFHSIYWDHYIAPEHDTPLTQKIKALGCHIPNLVITLTYLALWDNALIFVSFQVVACTCASIGMRFPSPRYVARPHDLAPRSAGRIPRCTGYLSPDPRTDPLTPFHPGWVGPGGTEDARHERSSPTL